MPKIKATYDTQDEIPEAYRDLFEQRGESTPGAEDGKFVLTQIEGLVTQANVFKLETANRKLREERDGWKKKAEHFGEKTPDDYHALEDKVGELEAQLATSGKPDEDKINQLVEARIKTIRGPLDRDLKKAQDSIAMLTNENGELKGSIKRTSVHNAVRAAASKAKVVATAVEDLLFLSERVFDVEESPDGNKRIITRDGVGCTPGIGPDDWLQEIGPTRPHIFPPNVGAGSTGSAGGGGGINGDNPWTKPNWNVTKQAQFTKEHGEDKARQVAKQAGSFFGATAPPQK